VVAGEILGLGLLPTLTDALLGFLIGFFVSGSEMILNDYFDEEVDKVNHPGSQVFSVPRRHGTRFASPNLK